MIFTGVGFEGGPQALIKFFKGFRIPSPSKLNVIQRFWRSKAGQGACPDSPGEVGGPMWLGHACPECLGEVGGPMWLGAPPGEPPPLRRGWPDVAWGPGEGPEICGQEHANFSRTRSGEVFDVAWGS